MAVAVMVGGDGFLFFFRVDGGGGGCARVRFCASTLGAFVRACVCSWASSGRVGGRAGRVGGPGRALRSALMNVVVVVVF